MKKKKAIIVGGGIGGLATAIALDKIGWDYVLLEQSPQIREIGASISIWNNGIHCLEVLGVKALFREKAALINKAVVQNHYGETLTSMDFLNSMNFPNSKEHFKILFSTIHRADLVNILLQAISFEKVFLNSQVQSFSEDTTGITVQLDSHKEFKGDFLIGADGIHSTIRKKLGDERALRYAGYTCWRGLVKTNCEFLSKEISILGMGPKSFYGLAWLKNEKLFWFSAVSTPSNPSKELKLNILKEAFSIWPDSIKEVINRTPSDSIIRNDIYDLPPM